MKEIALKISLVHKCAADSETFKWITSGGDEKEKALMEDKSEYINKRDIIAEWKKARLL